jgi:hypothetical protein
MCQIQANSIAATQTPFIDMVEVWRDQNILAALSGGSKSRCDHKEFKATMISSDQEEGEEPTKSTSQGKHASPLGTRIVLLHLAAASASHRTSWYEWQHAYKRPQKKER